MLQYPAKFEKEEKFYILEFIDFPQAFTQGKTMEQLVFRAQDVLSIAIKHNLDRNIPIPPPSNIMGENIMLIDPSPEIRQRMGHKEQCQCPICRTARNERKQTKVLSNYRINNDLLIKLEDYSKKKKVSKTNIIETALNEYLEKHSLAS